MFIFLLIPFDIRLFLFWIKSQLGVTYKSVAYKKSMKRCFIWSSKNEEITISHEFIFVFIWYFIGAILSKRFCLKREFLKKIKREGRP